MSELLSESPVQRSAATARKRAWPRWTREPLLHFVLLGALLFAIDHTIAGRADDPRTIMVDASVDSHARQVFKAARGRDPNAEELYALRRVWLDNEVLYREGMALQVDRGDSAIRERVIFKALSIVESNLKLPPFDDKILRTWFDAHRDKYDEPARYDFQEAVLIGEGSESAARTLVDTLNKGKPGELSAGLRVYKGRPRGNVVHGYGEDFAKTLEQAAPNQWQAVHSRDGWRVIQLNSSTPPTPAKFETMRGVVLQDWTDEKMAGQRSAAVAALARKYTVRYEDATK